MPLQEAVADMLQDIVADEATTAQPSEPEHMLTLGDEIAQGYEYARQDGTVEHATNREEAIKLCPVLGKLATKDPEAANLLLDVASMGQAKMAEKTERLEPAARKPTEPAAKPEKNPEPAEQIKVRSAEKIDTIRAEALTEAEITHLQRQAQETVVQDMANNEKRESAEIITERNNPKKSVPARTKVELKPTSEPEPEQHLSEEQSGLPRHHAVEDRLIHERQPIITCKEAGVANEIQPIIEPEAPRAIVEQAQTEPVASEAVSQTTELVDDTPVPVESTPDIEPKKTEPAYLADKSDKEPLPIYEDFNEILQLLIALSNNERPETEPDQPMVIQENKVPDIAEAQEILPYPDIAAAVAKRLNELEDEDKENAAPVLTDIAKTLRVIETLKTEVADSETLEAVQMELEELAVVLFEKLGIDYETEDIKKFTTILLHSSDFQPLQPAAEIDAPDLEHNGTREAKLSFSQQIGSISDTTNKAQRLLGRLIVVHYLLASSAQRGLEPN